MKYLCDLNVGGAQGQRGNSKEVIRGIGVNDMFTAKNTLKDYTEGGD